MSFLWKGMLLGFYFAAMCVNLKHLLTTDGWASVGSMVMFAAVTGLMVDDSIRLAILVNENSENSQ